MSAPANEILIRPMVSADLARVVAIADSLPGAPRWPRSAYVTMLDPNSIPRRIVLIASDSGSNRPLGLVVASLVPPQAELESIAVAAGSQRRGVGRRLVHALVEDLRRQGTAQLFLEVRGSNHAAQAFYCSLGFIRTGQRPGYYADPKEDAILMGLQLS